MRGVTKAKRTAHKIATAVWPPPGSDRNNEKIICAGWHRTATTSIHIAMQKLGYTVHGFDPVLMKQLLAGDTSQIWREARRSNGFRDFQWSVLWRDFERRYPNSKFIVTLRDEDAWLESYKRHHDRYGVVANHTWLYEGVETPHGNEEHFKARFRRHNDEIISHFAGSSRLLVFDAFAGHGWDELCGFLGKPVPSEPFPTEKSKVL